MGGVGGKNAAPPLSLMAAFEQACPMYLLWGMTYEQYWDGDVSAHKMFKRAAKLRRKQTNEDAWLQAAYIYEAMCAASSLFRGMKPSRPQKFRDEPYDIFEEDRKRREEEESRAKYEAMREKVAAFAKAFNEQRNSKESEVDGDARCAT